VAPKSVVVALEVRDLQVEQQRFREFLSEIAPAKGGKESLMFMHLQLPHAPYMLEPDGSVHPESPAGFEPAFAGNAALLERLRGDYEKQIAFVDRELGNFLDRLRQAGLYDQALIVVTSDHGVSWKDEAPGRVLSRANADMIFPVPLLVKLPGQRDGRVSKQDVQLIDLVPTIAAIAGTRVPWQVAGRNAFAQDDGSRQKIMIDANGRTFAYPSNFAETMTSK
jgi:arylsulfatase A-like enzyme